MKNSDQERIFVTAFDCFGEKSQIYAFKSINDLPEDMTRLGTEAFKQLEESIRDPKIKFVVMAIGC